MVAAFDPICLLTVLTDHDVEFVLVGGMAAVLHGSPTATNDADIVPSRTPENLNRLAAALRQLDARIRSATEVDGITFEPHPELLASMSMLNLTTRCGDLDLTFNPSGIGAYEDIRPTAVRFELDGFAVLVAALDDVIRSKLAADRPKDRAVMPVLEALREELGRGRPA
jgi:hypothetical protein